jgi:hypothetical protein
LPWTNYARDTFFGHKLSELTACGAEELPELGSYLTAFVLSGIFQVRYDQQTRSHAFNFIRRIQQASYEYGQGRIFLAGYLEKPNEAISSYYSALSHFEQCVALVVQSAKFRERSGSEKLFKQGTNSDLVRLERIYNASKHMDGQIAKGRLPTNAVTAVWITNVGLESRDAKNTFKEIRDLVIDGHEIARQIVEERPKRIHETFAADAGNAPPAKVRE